MAQSIIPVGNFLICSETAEMVIPQGGAHVRQVEFRFPLFQDTPTVTTTIYSNESPGTAFVVWDITINVLGSQTQIVVSAANTVIGQPVDYVYLCGIIAVGEPAEL